MRDRTCNRSVPQITYLHLPYNKNPSSLKKMRNLIPSKVFSLTSLEKKQKRRYSFRLRHLHLQKHTKKFHHRDSDEFYIQLAKIFLATFKNVKPQKSREALKLINFFFFNALKYVHLYTECKIIKRNILSVIYAECLKI